MNPEQYYNTERSLVNLKMKLVRLRMKLLEMKTEENWDLAGFYNFKIVRVEGDISNLEFMLWVERTRCLL